MNQIGSRIYYDKSNGSVIVRTSEMEGYVIQPTIEQDFKTYKELEKRLPTSVGVIQLAFGQYRQDFIECNGVKVNLKNFQLEFSYPEEGNEGIINYIEPLTAQVKRLQEKTFTALEKFEAANLSMITVEEYGKLKIEVLKADCTKAITDGFQSTSTGFKFGFNEWDQANFTQQMLMIVSGETADIYWKTLDKGIVKLTANQFKVVINEAKNHKIVQQQKYWNLEAQVMEAVTLEDIQAVIW